MDIGQNATICNRYSPQELAQLLIISHRKLYMPRHDPVLLVVPCRVPSQLQNLNTHNHIRKKHRRRRSKNAKSNPKTSTPPTFTDLSGEVLEDGREIDGGAGADALGVLAGLEEAGDPSDRKLEAGLLRPRDGFGGPRLPPSALRRRRGTHRVDETLALERANDGRRALWEGGKGSGFVYRIRRRILLY